MAAGTDSVSGYGIMRWECTRQYNNNNNNNSLRQVFSLGKEQKKWLVRVDACVCVCLWYRRIEEEIDFQFLHRLIFIPPFHTETPHNEIHPEYNTKEQPQTIRNTKFLPELRGTRSTPRKTPIKFCLFLMFSPVSHSFRVWSFAQTNRHQLTSISLSRLCFVSMGQD